MFDELNGAKKLQWISWYMPRWARDEDGGGDVGLVVRLQMDPFINCNHNGCKKRNY